MRNQLIIFGISLFLLLSFKSGFDNDKEIGNSVVHKVMLADPIKDSYEEIEHDLIEVQDEQDMPTGFYMDVESVYCSDSVCKVVPVRLYWDILGNYLSYKLQKGYKLEKDKGKRFRKGDYRKLHEILENEQSLFRGISINDITKSVSSEGVDAISGATSIMLPEDATIKGATLTCYTLWRWAHGSIRDSIIRISGDGLSVSVLKGFLQMEDEYKQYSINQLGRREIFDEDIVNAIIQQNMDDANRWSKLQMNYLDGAPDSTYLSSISELLKSGDIYQQNASLNSLLQTQKIVSEEYFDSITILLSKMDSYQTIDIFLRLMEKKFSGSEVLINQALLLLKKDILIARRAYWFLKSKDLSHSQQEVLDTFFEQNRDYL